MLRHLLATRFKLAVWTETRNGPAYDLVIDGKDGRVGPHLTQSSADCAALRAKLPPRPLAPPPNAPLIPGASHLNVVLNWFEELTQRARAK